MFHLLKEKKVKSNFQEISNAKLFHVNILQLQNENKSEATTAAQGPLNFRFGSDFWYRVPRMYYTGLVL